MFCDIFKTQYNRKPQILSHVTDLSQKVFKELLRVGAAAGQVPKGNFNDDENIWSQKNRAVVLL